MFSCRCDKSFFSSCLWSQTGVSAVGGVEGDDKTDTPCGGDATRTDSPAPTITRRGLLITPHSSFIIHHSSFRSSALPLFHHGHRPVNRGHRMRAAPPFRCAHCSIFVIICQVFVWSLSLACPEGCPAARFRGVSGRSGGGFAGIPRHFRRLPGLSPPALRRFCRPIYTDGR